MDEIFQITEYVQAEAGYGTDLIWGNCYDESLGDKLSVTIIATGFEQNILRGDKPEKIVVDIDDDPGVPRVQTESTAFEITNERNVNLEPVVKEPAPPVENKSRHSYHDPYVRKDEVEKREEIKKTLREKENLRVADTTEGQPIIQPPRMHNAEWIQEMTTTPAFARRKIQLDDVAPSSDLKMSRLTVTDDEGDDVLGKNTYLYDKPC